MLSFLLRTSAKAMCLCIALQGTARQMRVTTTMVLVEAALYGAEHVQHPLETPKQTPEVLPSKTQAVSTMAVPANEWNQLKGGIPWRILAVAHSLLDVSFHWLGVSPCRMLFRSRRARQRSSQFRRQEQS